MCLFDVGVEERGRRFGSLDFLKGQEVVLVSASEAAAIALTFIFAGFEASLWLTKVVPWALENKACPNTIWAD